MRPSATAAASAAAESTFERIPNRPPPAQEPATDDQSEVGLTAPARAPLELSSAAPHGLAGPVT